MGRWGGTIRRYLDGLIVRCGLFGGGAVARAADEGMGVEEDRPTGGEKRGSRPRRASGSVDEAVAAVASGSEAANLGY